MSTLLSLTTPLFGEPTISEKRMDKIVKCLVIGDGAIGKTTLIMRYCTGSMPPECYPVLYTESLDPTPHNIEGVDFELVIFDTGGGEDYDRLRPLSYPETDIFMMCFSLVDPASFQRVRKHYAPEVARLNPNTPVLLVGTKVDLRDSRAGPCRTCGARPITHHDGLDLCHEIKAAAYMECSALTDFNVTAVFDQAMRLACTYYIFGQLPEDSQAETCKQLTSSQVTPIFNTVSKKKRLSMGCIIV